MSLLLESAHVLDTTREQKLCGSFDIGEIFDDEDARVQIAANAARASGVHEAIDAMSGESDDMPMSGTIGGASEAEVSCEAEDSATPESYDDDEHSAGSFLRRYGIGTRSWLSEKHGFANDTADDPRVSKPNVEALGRSPEEQPGSRPRPRRH